MTDKSGGILFFPHFCRLEEILYGILYPVTYKEFISQSEKKGVTMKKTLKQIYTLFFAVMLILSNAKEEVPTGNTVTSISSSAILQNTKPGTPPPPPLPEPIPIEGA